MIFLIDEDETQVRPFKTELEIRGLKVISILSADAALHSLKKRTDIDLAIIDVMLAADTNGDTKDFSRENTKDFKTTGLRLLERLVELNPTVFPNRAVLFSMATTAEMVSEIKIECGKFGVEFLRKAEFASPLEFGDKIEEILTAFQAQEKD